MYRRLRAIALDESHRDNLRAVLSILRLAGIPMSEEPSSADSTQRQSPRTVAEPTGKLISLAKTPSTSSGDEAN